MPIKTTRISTCRLRPDTCGPDIGPRNVPGSLHSATDGRYLPVTTRKRKPIERFDPLFSGGLGNFLPGIVFSKVYKNSNLITNRATLSIKPLNNLELTLGLFQSSGRYIKQSWRNWTAANPCLQGHRPGVHPDHVSLHWRTPVSPRHCIRRYPGGKQLRRQWKEARRTGTRSRLPCICFSKVTVWRGEPGSYVN